MTIGEFADMTPEQRQEQLRQWRLDDKQKIRDSMEREIRRHHEQMDMLNGWLKAIEERETR